MKFSTKKLAQVQSVLLRYATCAQTKPEPVLSIKLHLAFDPINQESTNSRREMFVKHQKILKDMNSTLQP